MKKIVLIAVACMVVCVSVSLKAQASNNLDLHTLVVEKNQQMEKLLQNRDAKATINFLHNLVQENAVFDIELDNPTLTKKIGKNTIKIGKVDYINSFIQGLSYIDDYKVKINTNDIKVSADKKSVEVTETMVEHGVIKRNKDPVSFNSKTTCVATYLVDESTLSYSKASCKTVTGATNTI
jgi:hypothetical protein